MFGKHTSCGSTSNVDVNLTLDLTDYGKTTDLTDYVKKDDVIFDDYAKKDNATFTGTTTIDTLAIADSGTSILGIDAQLHFHNIGDYYAFHIDNYPYFYITPSSCYVNTTLGIDTIQEQIVFYRENNFWYFKAEDNGDKLQIKSGTSLTNWNSDAFEFYQNGNLKIPGTCRSNGLYNTSTLHQGGAATFLSSITSNCLEN